MNTKSITLIALSAALALAGCKKDNDDTPTTPNARTLSAVFEGQWGNMPFTLGANYTDGFGSTVQFSTVRMYLSNFQATNASGMAVGHFPSAVLLFDASMSNSLTLGTLAEGDLSVVSGYIGLDSITNHADPTLAQPPLNDATMHWGWNPMAGYKFAVIEGQVDTDADGMVDTPFVYHLATDALYSMFSLPIGTSIAQGQTFVLQVELDMQQAMAGIDVANNLDTHTSNEPALAGQLMSNLVGALEVQ